MRQKGNGKTKWSGQIRGERDKNGEVREIKRKSEKQNHKKNSPTTQKGLFYIIL